MNQETNLTGILQKNLSRRTTLKAIAAGAAGLTLGIAESCKRDSGNRKSSGDFPAEEGEIIPITTRKNPKNGDEISLLGFGCMRLPSLAENSDNQSGGIDEALTEKMVDYAYRHGLNYFDTAWIYAEGYSEIVMGRILKKYPRESFFLADKMPLTFLIEKTLASAKRTFEFQLAKCQTDYFDYYLMHAINTPEQFQHDYLDSGVLEYLKELKKEGRIRNLGFSFHAPVEVMHYMLSLPEEWDFIMIQLNYHDWKDERLQAETLYNLITERNIPVMVMEPIRGGTLARLNEGVVEMYHEADPTRSPASWALRFCASLPNVITVLSGMSAVEHVVDNIKTFTPFEPITDENRAMLAAGLELYKQNRPLDCTACNYCMPCPYGVNISGIYTTYNKCANGLALPDPDGPHDAGYRKKRRIFLNRYKNTLADREQAHRCISCGKCLPLCPQQLNIPEDMKNIETLVHQLRKS